MDGSGQDERAARNQSLFREVNERLAELNGKFEPLTPYGRWACECAALECVRQIEMTMGEYEALRQHPARFVVLPSEKHLVPDVEHVVEKTDRYWVVEKVGQAGVLAEELESTG